MPSPEIKEELRVILETSAVIIVTVPVVAKNVSSWKNRFSSLA